MNPAAQMFLVQNDDVVQAFPADGADQAFDHWILPRWARGSELLFHAQAPGVSSIHPERSKNSYGFGFDHKGIRAEVN
jgi:hypothetical protein